MKHSILDRKVHGKSVTDELVFESSKKITLRCGDGAIELLPNGNIIIKGKAIYHQAKECIKLLGERIELN